MLYKNLSYNDIMEEKNSSEQIPVNNEAKETNSEDDDFLSLINNLLQFESYIKTLKNINDIFTKENLDFLKIIFEKKYQNKFIIHENIYEYNFQ